MGIPQWQGAPDAQDAIVKLHRGDPVAAVGGRRGLSPALRLSELVAQWYKPVYLLARDARPRHYEQIDETISLWVALTNDPPLAEIDAWHTRDFVLGLKARPGRKYPTLGNNTVRKHCGAIQAILDLCGPPSRDNREGLGLLDAALVPYVSRPPADDSETAEDTFTLGELVQLIENADAAELPKLPGVSPGAYFRRLYTWTFNTGLRIGGTMMASWRGWHGDHLELRARVAAKGRKTKRIELNDAAQEIATSMQGIDPERIFPWPRAWPVSRHGLYNEHARIAGCLPERRRFAFHAIRRLHNNELAEINPLACQKSLGHTTGRTTVENYTARRVVKNAVDRLPAVRPNRDKQQRLF
jgi:hypothetical protein